MSNEKILIIEDDKTISHFISRALQSAHYRTVLAENAKEANMLFLSELPDLVLLDLGLPDADGMTVLSKMKEWRKEIPVIIVSARTQESDIVKALDSDADDYMTKPFGVSELMARIRTALRRKKLIENSLNSATEMTVYELNGLKLDVEHRHVTLDGEEIHLTVHEFQILELLFKYQGKVLTHSFILRNIWGDYIVSDNRILRVNMANIRRKLKEDPNSPRFIQTELGVGYRMLDSEHAN